MGIIYYLNKQVYATRVRNAVPRVGDLVRLEGLWFTVKGVLWLEDEYIGTSQSPRVFINIEQVDTDLDTRDS